MFLVGLELDFSRMERQGRKPLLINTAVACLVFVVAFGIALLLNLSLFFGLVFGAASVGIMLVTLAETGLQRIPLGQDMIFVGSVGEALTIVLLTLFSLYYQFGVSWTLFKELAELSAIFGAAYGVLMLLRTLIWWFPASFSRLIQQNDPTEVGVRAGLALMLAFVAFAALLGVDAILGAFVAGALVSFVFRDKEVLHSKFSSIGFGFFVPLFFIWVGIRFDLRAAWNPTTWSRVALFFGASLVTKIAPSMLLILRGVSAKGALGTGFLLSTPLTLLVAVAEIGQKVRIIDNEMSNAIVLLAVVTALVLPALFRVLHITDNT